MTRLTLEQAERIIDRALAEGKKRGFKPLTVAVLDAGGHLVALKRQDGASNMRPEIAGGKAWGALALGFGSRELAERATKTPAFINALAAVAQGRLVPVPGGVLAEGPAGEVIGAVGISGDTSDNDEICAVAGIESAGLRPRVGA